MNATANEIDLVEFYEKPMPPLDEMKPLADFAQSVRANYTTIYRWVKFGVETPAGRVKLLAWQLGEWCTTEAEIRDFIQRRTQATINGPVKPDNAADIRARVKAAKKSLAKKGMKFPGKNV